MSNATSVRDMSQPVPKYWIALGEFIWTFSYTEAEVFGLLCRVAEIDVPVGKVLISGKMDALTRLVRDVFKARALTIPSRLNAALVQIATINDMRNNLIHFNPLIRPDGSLTLSNTFRKLVENEKTVPVSHDVVERMTRDLITIGQQIFLVQIEISGRVDSYKGADFDALVDRANAPYEFSSPAPLRRE